MTTTRPKRRRLDDPTCRAVWESASCFRPALSELDAVVRYGEYLRVEHEEGYSGPQHWQRIPREEIVPIKIGSKVPANGVVPVPNSRGVELVWSIRGVPDADIDGGLPKGTRSLSVFVVNRRKAAPDEVRDEGFIFQVELELQSDTSFVARPNLRSLESDDWDERVADLQYPRCVRVLRRAQRLHRGRCRRRRVPDGEDAAGCRPPKWKKSLRPQIPNVTLEMEALALLRDGDDAQEKLGSFVTSYKEWIERAGSAVSSHVASASTQGNGRRIAASRQARRGPDSGGHRPAQ